MREQQGIEMTRVLPARGRGIRDWRRWAPGAAIVWSVAYGAMGMYWVVSGRGFPYSPEPGPGTIAPLIRMFGLGVAWLAVMTTGVPAAALGVAMLRGVRSRALRPLFITAGALLTVVLLLLMTSLDLLVLFGYIPYVVVALLRGGAIGGKYVASATQWATIHQVLCLIGGFLWLAATVCYGRRSGDACLYCGRRDGTGEWQNPDRAARWGRIAVYVAMIAPLFYAFTRYAWALGFPLGMSEKYFRSGQQSGAWTAGLFLANFGLVGAALMLGLVQRWGEVFPRWMIGLAGRCVPIGLAVIPAALVSVLLIVGGIALWSGLGQIVARVEAGGAKGIGLVTEILFPIGPVLLFPVWGVALAVATLGYYYRRRGPCGVCGRGASTRSRINDTGRVVLASRDRETSAQAKNSA